MLKSLLISAAAICCIAASALGQATLRAPLKPGAQMRYTVTIDQRYTTTFIPPEKPPNERATWQQATAKLTVKDAGADKATVELVYETYHFKLTAQNGDVIDIDAAGVPPSAADQTRTAFYNLAKAMVATTFTLQVKPDGTIEKVTGFEELTKNSAGRLARRYIEEEGIKANFSPILALRAGNESSNIGDKWVLTWTVLADRFREQVAEGRTVAAVADGKTTVKGEVHHSGKTANVGGGGIYLRDCLGNMTYTWDDKANALASAKIEDNITFVMMNPDSSKNEMNTVTTTTIAPAQPAAKAAPAGAQVEKK